MHTPYKDVAFQGAEQPPTDYGRERKSLGEQTLWIRLRCEERV